MTALALLPTVAPVLGGFFSSSGGLAVFVLSILTVILLFWVLATVLRMNRFLKDILPPTSPFLRTKEPTDVPATDGSDGHNPEH